MSGVPTWGELKELYTPYWMPRTGVFGNEPPTKVMTFDVVNPLLAKSTIQSNLKNSDNKWGTPEENQNVYEQ